MNSIKKLIKKIIKKLLSEIFREIEQVKDIQNQVLDSSIEIKNKNIELSQDIKELEKKNDKLNENITELKNSSEIANKIDELSSYIGRVEQENAKLKNYIENITLTINRKDSIRKIRVVFLIHNVESWYSMQPIYEAMLKDDEFNPIIISIPRNYNSHDGTFEDKSTEYLERKYNRIISFKNYENIPSDILYILNPDIIFRQSPWDDDIPEVFRTNNIKQFRVCYIPYAVNSLPLNELSLNQVLYGYAWRIYCQSEFDRESYRKYNLVSDLNALVSGFTKFEQMSKLINENNKKLVWPIQRKTKSPIRILWTPHHSLEGWFGFSTFHIIYEKMYDFLLNNSDIEIVLRPHPALTEVMNNSGLIGKEKLEEYYKNFNNLENGYVDFSAEYINLFKYSDILISDGVSFLFEYIITGKPIIHTDSKKHIEFNEFGKQFESSWYKAYSFDDLIEYISMIKNGNDALLEQRLSLKENLFDFSEENKPSKIIIDDIKSSLLNK